MFIVCWCIGSCIGNIARAHRKEGVGLIAGWFGVCLGLVIANMLHITNYFVFWIFIIGMGCILAYMSMKFEKPIVIISTSFLGAFIIISSIALMTGHYSSIKMMNTSSMS
jgi:hypothetical protein